MSTTLLRLRRVALCLLVVTLCACRSDLFTAMSEPDCNEALAVLLSAGIAADKASPDNGKTWNLRVPEDRIVRALELLRERGLPRSHFSSLGELFKKDGLISTPVEERVRFVHGISQELSETLSRMDGVIVARVHIVLPNNDPLATEVKPSSASVFIKYRPDLAVSSLMSPVKNLVAHSVEGLSYEQVSVTFVPGDPAAPSLPDPSESGTTLAVALALLGSLLACLGLLTGWAWKRPERAARGIWPMPVILRTLRRLGLVRQTPARAEVVA
ncbi:type III secretion system inner membrane ring lipoprotein SctJ [Xylophilus sp. GOD-11R]|uniref:type III secretion system inner membrane ring lipoprotein SctJ n=1 Tax=Xylophilus sp. GOD-11R TaxID=3089814 RepID=UPI00298C13EE|nr:type III secretion inner membrane ring lipoprotein SctJ [Xylophilus sp. GOD-11R]WPB57940.1 type III secretion inner membrane ring lipoprotein SctJ [Xylophilus sp. GOD-11R]